MHTGGVVARRVQYHDTGVVVDLILSLSLNLSLHGRSTLSSPSTYVSEHPGSLVFPVAKLVIESKQTFLIRVEEVLKLKLDSDR